MFDGIATRRQHVVRSRCSRPRSREVARNQGLEPDGKRYANICILSDWEAHNGEAMVGAVKEQTMRMLAEVGLRERVGVVAPLR
jgi:hypothetical protein